MRKGTVKRRAVRAGHWPKPRADWPQRLPEADFIVVTSALTASSRHLVNAEALALAKPKPKPCGKTWSPRWSLKTCRALAAMRYSRPMGMRSRLRARMDAEPEANA